MSLSNGFVLLSGTANPKLASDIAKILYTPLFEPIDRFADSEARVQIPTNLRRKSVFIIQPTCPPNVDSYFMELLLMIDASRRSSAEEISAIIPYFGYSRQDRKDKPRVPISSAMIARIIEFVGADRVCTIDIHSDQEQGFIQQPWDNLYSSYSLIPELEKLKLKDLVIASPDKGGVLKATAYAKRLQADGIAIVFKERDVSLANKSEALDMIGEVDGKTVLLVDDMVDTAGTLCNAANLIKKRGAKKVYACSTHGLFSADALEKINNSAIELLLVTDTIPTREDVNRNKKIKVVTVAPLIAEAIKRMLSGESISQGLII